MNLRCLAFFGFAVAIATTFFVGTLAVHEPQCVDFWGMVLQNIDPDSIVPDIVQNVLSKLFPEMDVQAIHQVQMVIEKDPGFMSAVDNVKIEFHKVEPMLRKGFCSFPVPVSGPCRLITEQYMKFSQEQDSNVTFEIDTNLATACLISPFLDGSKLVELLKSLLRFQLLMAELTPPAPKDNILLQEL